MNQFVEGYKEFLEEHMEPQNPQKYGRYHKLLDETIYPLNDNLPWLCDVQYARNKFERDRKMGKGVYNWWIHFNEFKPWGEDLRG